LVTLRKENAERSFSAAEWSPDGRFVAAAVREGQGTRERFAIQVWDATTAARARRFQDGHTSRIAALSWSPDGKRMVSCSHDQTAKVWDVSTGAAALTLTGHAGDALPGSRSPTYWDFGYQPSPSWQHQLRAGLMAWSADGRRLATASHF